MTATFAKASIGATPEAITASSILNKYGAEIKAVSTNTGIVYVGISDVTTAIGFPLSAGQSVLIPPAFVENINEVFVVASAPGQEVRVIVYKPQ